MYVNKIKIRYQKETFRKKNNKNDNKEKNASEPYEKKKISKNVF